MNTPPQNHADDGLIPEPYYVDTDNRVSNSTEAERSSKIRLTPINYLTALLINHPQLADHVDNTELLETCADADTSLFLRLLKLVRDNPSYKPSHIFAYWLGANGNQQETQRLQELAASELYHPPSGTGRDDNREFCDALSHVLQQAFYQLPPLQQAMHLLERESLEEREIKQLLKLHLQLPEDAESQRLKQLIKQRLVD
jgi:DNA primase